MKCFHYLKLDSTQTQAEDLLEKGQATPFMVLADSQSTGQGTYQKSWLSEPGGLFASIALPLTTPTLSATELTVLPLEVGLHLKALITQLAPQLRPQLKWPNDIKINTKKCAGILMKLLPGQQGASATLIIGIGLNVN